MVSTTVNSNKYHKLMITNLYLLSDPVFHTHGNHNYYTEYSMPYEEGLGGGGGGGVGSRI